MASRGKKTITARIALEGADKLEHDLKQLGVVGAAAFKQIQKAGGVDLAVGFRRQLAAISKDFGNVRRTFADVGRASATFVRNMSLIGVAVAGATAGVIAFTRAGTEAVDVAGKQAQALGLAVDEYGRLAHAADQSGVAQEQFASGMSRLNRNIGDAVSGSKTALEAFEQIGVSFKDSEGNIRPVEAIMLDLAEAFSRMPEGAQKSALAMELFGRAGAQMIPFLNSGRDGLRQLGEEAERLGIVFTEAQFRIAERFNDALARIAIAAKGIRSQIAIAFAPGGTRLADAFTEALVRSQATLTAIATDIASRVEPVLRDLLATLSGDDAAVIDRRFIEWRDAVVQFGQDIGSVISGVVLPTFRAIGEAASAAARGINAVFGTDISGGAVLLTVAIGKVTGAFAVLTATARLALATIGFFAKHPAIAAVLLLSGRFAALANQQTIAEQAADEHTRALEDLDAAMARAGTASSEARDNLRREAEASLAAAAAKREQIAAAIDELALINAIRKVDETAGASAFGDLLIAGQVEQERKALEAYVGEQDKLIAGLQLRARELAKADKETVNLTRSTEDAAAALEEAGEKARSAFPGPAANVRSVSANPFASTTEGAREAGEEAERSGEKVGTATDRMAAHIRTVPEEWRRAGQAAADMAAETAAAAETIAPALDGIAPAVEASREAIAAAKGDLLAIGEGATGASEQIKTTFGALPAELQPVWQQVAGDAQAAGAQLVPPFQAASAGIVATFGQMVQQIAAQLRQIVSIAASVAAGVRAQMSSIVAAANAAKAAVASVPSGGGGGFALGGQYSSAVWRGVGQVRGPGTTTSDDINARLSDREFVHPAAAVDYYGLAFMEAVRWRRLPQNIMDMLRAAMSGLRGFRDGGPVLPRFQAPRFEIPRFATGGLMPATAGGGNVRDMGVLTLRPADGDGFRIQGPVDVLDTFAKAMNRANLTRTGRGPARLRG